jgi:uncharacterized membrane protein YdjX (TVP38/TMEM64 family)
VSEVEKVDVDQELVMSEVRDSADETGGGRFPVVKVALGLLLLVAMIALVKTLPTDEWLAAVQAWVQGLGVTGWVIYALVYAVCCIFFIPATVLTLGAGAIFGLAKGTGIVVIGATLGATLSFLLARGVFRQRVEKMTSGNTKFRALDRAIGHEGAKIVFLIRLAPIFPFTYINYAFGLTGVRTLPYTVSTMLGIIPGTFAFVYLGHSAAQAAGGVADQTRLVINIVGAVVAVIATIFVARVATKAIKKAGIEEEGEPGVGGGPETSA